MPIEVLRSWRVVLFGAALLSVLFVWRRPLLALLWAFAVFQMAIHLPVLYLHRYSVPALDVPLALLAGIGASLALLHVKLWLTLIVAGLTWLAFWIVPYTTLDPSFPVPNVDAVPHRVIAAYSASTLPIGTSTGFARSPAGTFTQVDEKGTVDFDFSSVDIRPGLLVRLEMRVSAVHPRGACEDVRLRFRPKASQSYAPDQVWYQRWPMAKGEVSLVFGGLAHIRFNQPGYLQLEFACKGVSIDVDRLELIHPLTVRRQRDTFFERNGVTSWGEWYERQHIRGNKGL
jgi:hypothetical protein